jgi:hypothetical protein
MTARGRHFHLENGFLGKFLHPGISGR